MRHLHALSTAVLGCALLLTGCFGKSTPATSDSGLPDFDAAFPSPEASTGHDAGPADAAADAPATGTFSTTPVDFGLANCGGQPTPSSKTYSFQNSGLVPITWSAAVGSVFAIQGPSSGTVAPGASATITVGVTTIPATSTAGVKITDALTITTDVPGFGTVTVPLNVTPQGGSLTLSGLSGFGSVTLGTPVTQPFTLSNVGNAPVSVTFGVPTSPQFTVTYTGAPAATAIAAGQSLAGASATFTPAATGAQSGSAAIQVTGVLCASPATSVALSGTGTTSPLSIGPSPLNFSTVTCGSTAPAQAITLQNSNAIAIAYTTALGLGASSPYTLDAPTGTVPANGKAVINVTPSAIPLAANLTAGFYNDMLTVTGQGLAPVVIPLQESAGGAILALTMATTDFGTVQNTTAKLPFTVANTGNQDASVTLTPTGTGFAAAFTGSATATANGGTAPGNASFTATTNGTAAGTLSVTAPNLCAPLPTALALSAVEQVPVATFPKGQGPFAVGVTCGGTATSASIIVTNSGLLPLTIVNPVSLKGHFSISGFTSPIAAGGTDTVTVTALEGGAAGSATPYADTLQFSTNEVGAPTHDITVNVTVTGVNLAISPATVSFTDCNDVAYSVVATGVLPGGDVVTVQRGANYCVGDCPSLGIGFQGGFDNPVSVTPGNSYGDSVYSDENSGCTPVNNLTVLVSTGPVCQSSLSISATFVSPGGCNACGASHG